MTYQIYKDGELVNRIEADENFVTRYCAEMGYSFEAEPETEPEPGPEPEQEPDDLSARVTALENDVTAITEAVERGLAL